MPSVRSSLRRYKGAISLLVAISGLLTTSLLLGDSQTPLALVLLNGFEAATVGALADWLAVKMLFDEIRVGGVRIVPASGIIPRKQEAIAKGAGKLVAEEWLSPASIQEFMLTMDFASAISTEWKTFVNSSSYMEMRRAFRQGIAGLLSDGEIRRNINTWIETRLTNLHLSEWFTKNLTPSDVEKTMERLLPSVLQVLNRAAQSPDFYQAILEKVQAERKGFLKQLLIDPVEVSESIQRQIIRLLHDLELDRAHSVRLQVNDGVYQWLQSEEFDRWVQRTAESAVEQGWMDRFMDTLGESMLATNKEDVHWMDQVLDELADRIGKYVIGEGRAAINDSLRSATGRLVASYHSQIAALVESNIVRLSPDEIKRQFKSRTYDDMQWIRVNGAVAGFLLGSLIGFLRYFFS